MWNIFIYILFWRQNFVFILLDTRYTVIGVINELEWISSPSLGLQQMKTLKKEKETHLLSRIWYVHLMKYCMTINVLWVCGIDMERYAACIVKCKRSPNYMYIISFRYLCPCVYSIFCVYLCIEKSPEWQPAERFLLCYLAMVIYKKWNLDAVFSFPSS